MSYDVEVMHCRKCGSTGKLFDKFSIVGPECDVICHGCNSTWDNYVVASVEEERRLMNCQLCSSGVPLFPSEYYKAHVVSWGSGTAVLIACDAEERKKMEAINKRLQNHREKSL